MTLGERWTYPGICGFCKRRLRETEQWWYTDSGSQSLLPSPAPHCGACAVHLSDICEWRTDP